MSQPSWPAETTSPARGLGPGQGAAVGALVGLLGPIVLGLMGWAGITWSSSTVGDNLVGLVLLVVVATPFVLLVIGCVLMVPDRLRGWGVAALVASGVWLLSSAGVCTVFFFGAMASYGNSAMMPL